MLMRFEFMMYCEPLGDDTFRFNVEAANREKLAEAIAFNDSYGEVYGHDIFVNIDDIKAAYAKTV